MTATMKLLIGMAVLLLAGCMDMPVRDDPKFAPTYPTSPPPSSQNNGAIYQAGYDVALFQDNKSRHVGDMLTVVLVEKTAASKSASTNTAKDTKLNVGTPTVFGAPVTLGGKDILGASATSSDSFAGKGDSSQSNSLSGNISVTVAKVLPNGNLMVSGEKSLTLNQGREFVQISGIVRPVDILSDNTVLSTQLADARIAYSGQGAVHDSNTMGWMARFFNNGLWPF